MRVSIRNNKRPGAVLPMVTVLLVGFMAFLGLAIDVGMLAVARSQAQSAADIGALSGARTLNGSSFNNNKDNAIIQARAATSQNYILRNKIQPNTDVPEIKCGMYIYATDPSTSISRFQTNFTDSPTSTDNYGAIQVRVQSSRPTFFGKLMGVNSMTASAVATAVHRPRDISVVLDFSGSMKNASLFNYPLSSSNIRGGLNPDSRFPRFGPWMLYPVATPGTPNPMHCLDPYIDSGYPYPPNNLTIESSHGPAMVNNFQTTVGKGAPNAFVYNNDLSAGSFKITNLPVCTPVPASWSSQYADAYDGDRWPLAYGVTNTNPKVSEYAKNVAEILFPAGTNVDSSTRKANWEKNGYDMEDLPFKNGQFKGYSMGPGYFGKTFYMWPPDPRFEPNADPTKVSKWHTARDSSGRMICDWRKRFFLKVSTDPATPGAVVDDNNLLFDSAGLFRPQLTVFEGTNYIPNYGAILSWLKSGPQTLPHAMRAGRVLYYDSIPDTIPLDWSTGLVLSSASPNQRFWKDYIDFVLSTGSHSRTTTLYGYGSNNTYGNSTFGDPKITAKSSLSGTLPPYMHYQDVPVHPRAHLWFGPLTMLGFISLNEGYSRVTQTFGSTYNWNAGTNYESHCWQLKAGINAALSDIKSNHPNDLASLIYFSAFTEPMVPMGKNFTKMQNSLFYPKSIVDYLGNINEEIRPYGTRSINVFSPSGLDVYKHYGDIPSAGGDTNLAMGLMNAYNQFNSKGSYTGRRGALKIVILETDGVANSAANASFSSISGGGGAMEWRGITAGFSDSDGGQTALDAGVSLAWLISQNTTGTKSWPTLPAYSRSRDIPNVSRSQNFYGVKGPGFSTPRSPAQVHTIAFGPLFESNVTTGSKTRALELLRNIQIVGGTSPANASSIESYKIIVGTYSQRIDLLRQSMRSIMQGGVLVSLIQ